jgi:hypothetical protein
MIADIYAKYVPHSGALHPDFIGCSEPDVELPYVWSDDGTDGSNGPAPKDPLMLYISIPALGDGEDPNSPMWALPLRAVVLDYVINLHIDGDGKLGSKAVAVITDIRNALQKLTDELSAEITLRTEHDPS